MKCVWPITNHHICHHHQLDFFGLKISNFSANKSHEPDGKINQLHQLPLILPWNHDHNPMLMQ